MLVLPEKTVSNESGEEDVVKSLALEELYMFGKFPNESVLQSSMQTQTKTLF